MRLISRVALVALFLAAPAARAQDYANCALDCPDSRELGGFTFIVSRLVRDPFNYTSVGLVGSYGYATVAPAQIPVLGTTFNTRQASLVAVGGGLTATVRALSWLSLRLDAANVVLSGDNGQSALVVGATARVLGDVGLTMSTQLGSNVRLGFIGSVATTPSIDVLPLSGIVSAVQSRMVSDTNVFSTTRNWTFSAGVAAAWGLGRAFGLDATLEFVHPRDDVNGTIENSNHLAAGLLGEFDLSKITPVAIAFTGAYRASNIFQSENNLLVQQVEGGIFYSGRRALNLGLTVEGRFFHVRPRFDTDAVIVSALLQYFWS